MVVFRVWRQGRRPEWGDTLRSNVRRLLRRVQRPEIENRFVYLFSFRLDENYPKGRASPAMYHFYGNPIIIFKNKPRDAVYISGLFLFV